MQQVLRSSGVAWETENIPQISGIILILLRKRGVKEDFSTICILKSNFLLYKGCYLQAFKTSPDRGLGNNRERSVAYILLVQYMLMHLAGKETLKNHFFTYIPKHPANTIPKFHSGPCQLIDHRKCRFFYFCYLYT